MALVAHKLDQVRLENFIGPVIWNFNGILVPLRVIVAVKNLTVHLLVYAESVEQKHPLVHLEVLDV